MEEKLITDVEDRSVWKLGVTLHVEAVLRRIINVIYIDVLLLIINETTLRMVYICGCCNVEKANLILPK